MDLATYPPIRSEVVDISSTNHTFTAGLKVTAIYNNSAIAGTVIAKLVGDAAARTWKVGAYQYLLGFFESVTRSGTTLTTANDLIGITGLPPGVNA